jgi:hypothetical protein
MGLDGGWQPKTMVPAWAVDASAAGAAADYTAAVRANILQGGDNAGRGQVSSLSHFVFVLSPPYNLPCKNKTD